MPCLQRECSSIHHHRLRAYYILGATYWAVDRRASLHPVLGPPALAPAWPSCLAAAGPAPLPPARLSACRSGHAHTSEALLRFISAWMILVHITYLPTVTPNPFWPHSMSPPPPWPSVHGMHGRETLGKSGEYLGHRGQQARLHSAPYPPHLWHLEWMTSPFYP